MEERKNSTDKNSKKIENFSAKILEGENDKHSEILSEAINDENIFNIALSGAYGSGKTSIIKTFKKKNNLEYIDISLATFDDKLIDTDNLLKLEYCILKQLFYRVSPEKVPQSRFKRIVNHKDTKCKAILFFFWLISILYFLNNKLLIILVEALGINHYCASLNFIYSIYSIAGLIYFVHKLYDFIINFNMIKLKFSEAEVENKNDKATLDFENEIDEILYFFERNHTDVVFIEDLDRFNNTEIFIKLREINFLINNYEPITKKGKVTFVYAVLDDIFTQNERTKFFDIILPVVPIINYTNSAKELLDRFENEINQIQDVNKRKEFVKFIEKVSLYLTDMRIIISISNEYKVYRKILNENIDEKKLFAMMVYKNVEPSDFDMLNKQKGHVYKLLKNKIILINDIIKKIEEETKTFVNLLDYSNNEILTNSKELRMLYIGKFLEIINKKYNHGVINIRLDSKKLSPTDLVIDENFELLTKINSITYEWYNTNTNTIDLTFNEIEKAVNPSINYSRRLMSITNKASKNIEDIKIKIEENQNKIKLLKSKKLSELLDELENNYLIDRQKIYEESIQKQDRFHKKIQNYDLINYLVKDGFIDEDYEHYISRQDGNLSKEDRDFLLSFNSKALAFDLKLNKINSILNKIDDSYFYKIQILNFSLMEYLIVNNKFIEINNIMGVLKDETENSILFIDEYLQSTNEKHKNIFIKSITDAWTNIFNYLHNKTDYSFEKKSTYLRLIFINNSISRIKELNKNGSIFYFLSNSESLTPIFFNDKNKNKVEKFLIEEKVQFDRLIFEEDHIQLLKFIYENNLYEINFDMIKLMLTAFKKNDIDLEEIYLSNYTLIGNSGCVELNSYIDDNIEYYLECVLFELENNLIESEQSFLKILNELVVSLELEIKLIEKNETIINKLTEINEKSLWSAFFINNKLKISWENVIEYFKEVNELDEVLINYLNQQKVYKVLLDEGIKENDEDIESQFVTKLIHSKITNESFNSLINKIPYTFEFSEIEELEIEKIKILIQNNMIPFSIDNFTGIKKNHESLITIFSELNKNDFLELIEELPFSNTILLDTLNSNAFSDENKLEIIKTIDENFILNDSNLRSFTCKFLLNQENISLSETLINSLLSSNNLISTKVALFNKYYLNSLALDKLNARLISLGNPFINLTENLETIDLNDTVENNQFYSLLYGRMLGQKKEKDGNIKIWQLKNKK